MASEPSDSSPLEASLPLTITLAWRAPVDLDLMAFYVGKNGQAGGVYSEHYSDGALGSLETFPFLRLSGDEGTDTAVGDCSEVLTIAKLDSFQELVVGAINFTEAVEQNGAVFAEYDAVVTIAAGERVLLRERLDSRDDGAAAVLCRLVNSEQGLQFTMENRVLSLADFRTQVAGAEQLRLASKITIVEKGESASVIPSVEGDLLVDLCWTRQPPASGFSFFQKPPEIDIDLGCYFELSSGDRAAIQPLNEGFFKQGSFFESPWIFHTGDVRDGGESELLKINAAQWKNQRRILLFAYLYEGAPRWTQSNATMSIKAPGAPPVEVQLNDHHDSHNFCAVAMLENAADQIKITKLLTFHEGHREADQYYGWGLNWAAGEK